MCGHVGIAGKLETKDENTLKRLLIFDYFRGPDSTGFAALRNNGDVKLTKIASGPIDLFDMNKFKDALNGFASSVFLGHNRLATKGSVNNYNAHPYMFDTEGGVIVGAHNGTLDKSSWEALETALEEKFEVDSMAVIAAIAKLGIEKTVTMLQGAWALVWFNTADGTLNFLRNKERPFWYAYSKTFDKLFWASEYPIMQAAIELSTVAYDLYITSEGFRFFATKENQWYKFDLKALAAGAVERPKPRIKELKGKEPAPVTHYSCAGQSPFHRTTQHSSMMTSSTTYHGGQTGSNLKGTQAEKDNVFPFIAKTSKDKPLGDYYTKEEFDKLAKYGCSFCATDVEYEERGVKIFQGTDQILCPSCADEGTISRIYVNQ